MTELTVIHEPEASLRRGYATLVREIVDEIAGSRWLLKQFFKREIAATYKQSVLGALWLVLTPLASVGTFLVLDASGVIDVGKTGAPYPVFAILGMASWQLFAAGLAACTQSLVGAGSMVAKIRFSRKSLVIAALGRGVVAYGVQMLLVVALLVAYGIPPRLAWVGVPFAALPLLALTLGLGFVLSLFNVVMRDVANALSTLLTFLLFLTPVLYQKPPSGTFATFCSWNPLHHLVSASRDLVLTGEVAEPLGFMLASLFAVATLGVGALVFHVTEARLAERISA